MEMISKKQTGHSIQTYRVRLYDRHFVWLKATKELHTQVVKHFFAVLEKESSLLEQSDFLLLRALETRCIGTKEMKAAGVVPEYPLDKLPKIPLYFRRSAINTAIDLARKKAGSMEPNMVLYKGMYQNFTDKTIELKLFNGEKWVWVNYPFTGRSFPENAAHLSPMLVLKKKNAWLEVPVSFEVEDVRTVKERMQTEERICALALPDNDAMAVAVVLSRSGEEQECRFFRGGKQKEEQRRQILARIRESEESRGINRQEEAKKQLSAEEMQERQQMLSTEEMQKPETQKQETAVAHVEKTEFMLATPKENSTLYAELRDLNRHYAHSISRQVIAFCEEQNIKVLVVPNYEKSIDFRDKKYLKTDAYRWLGRSIIKNLKYKAFQKGIVVTSIPPYHITDRCSECGEKIRKYNEGHNAGEKYYGGKLYKCPNGHSGNTAQNTARNVGKSFLGYFEKRADSQPGNL